MPLINAAFLVFHLLTAPHDDHAARASAQKDAVCGAEVCSVALQPVVPVVVTPRVRP